MHAAQTKKTQAVDRAYYFHFFTFYIISCEARLLVMLQEDFLAPFVNPYEACILLMPAQSNL